MKTKALLIAIGLLLAGQLVSAQKLTITGTVTEAGTGEPLVGVAVFVKGASSGAVTDIDGKYSAVADSDATLTFSCIGFVDKEVQVAGKTVIDVQMSVDATMLEEVVMVGYGTVKKNDLTGSVASVKAVDVIKSSSGSIEKQLQGRVAGLTVIDTSNDSPDASVTMRIRGVSSLNGSNAPLMVVDGVPMGDAGNLRSVNPNIIESIEVLKDASATAIYGSRGANGVIIITTKQGKEQHTDIWFNGKVGVGMFSKPLDIWGKDDLITMMEATNASYNNAGYEGPYSGKTFTDNVYYPSVEEVRSGQWPYYTDWIKEVFRTSVTQDYNVGIDGGDDHHKYYVGIGYYDGQGMRKLDDYTKFSLDASYKVTLFKKLDFTLKAGVVKGKRTSPMDASYNRNPLWPKYNGDGSYYRTNDQDFGNPLSGNLESHSRSNHTTWNLNAKIDWRIIDGLTFTATGGYQNQSSRSNVFYSPVYSSTGFNYNGHATVGESTYDLWSADATLTYDKTFNKNHISAMLGGSFDSRLDNGSSITGYGYTNTVLKEEIISGAETVTTSTSRSQWAILSSFTRLNYDWDGKYFATFTARLDGSSKFAKNHKWGFFPSGALSWRLDREPWLKSTGFFDLFKIRASFGVSGNQGISPYQTFEAYGSDKFFTGGTEETVYGLGYSSGRGHNSSRVTSQSSGRFAFYAGMANGELTWEKTSQTDIGLDLSIFKGRLDMTMDFYYKYTWDLLREQYLSPSTGFDTVWINDGTIENKGFELSLTGRIVDTKDWTLSATGILSVNRNKVISLGESASAGFETDVNGISFTPYSTSCYSDSYLNVLAIGYPVNVFYGYKCIGIIQETLGTGSEPNLKPGEINYVGLMPDGTLDTDQRMIIGDPNPKFTGSLSLNLTHSSGFDFSLLLYGVYGNDIFSMRKLSKTSPNDRWWTWEKPSFEYPSRKYTRQYHASTWSVEDGSYLRISNITVGYTLQSGNIKWLDKFRIFVSCNNPYVFANTSEYDPEVGENGNSSPAYPRICTITTGIELRF